MAKEKNFMGFEIGVSHEFDLFDAGCSFHQDTSLARTGDWFLRLNPSSQQSQARITSDSVVLTGSYAGSGHLRFHITFYMKVNTLPSGGPAQLFLLDTTCALFMTSGGVLQVNFTGHSAVNGPSLTVDGLWHKIDLDFDMDGGSPSNSVWKVAVDGGSYTQTTLVSAGAFGLLNYSFGDHTTQSYAVDIDDVVMFAYDQSDAASPITMPTATRVLPTPVTAQGSFNQWSNTYVNVQDVPPSTSPDTYQASTVIGQKVTYQKGDLSWFAVPGNEVDGVKVYAWVRMNGSGTSSVECIINGNIVKTQTGYPLIPAGYPTTGPLVRGGFDFNVYTIANFDAMEFGLIQNGTLEARVGAMFMEILVVDVVPVVNSITPNTGTWKGGTFFTVTGLYFTPTTQIIFGPDGAATQIVWTDSKHMSGLTPANPSGAGTQPVTAQ